MPRIRRVAFIGNSLPRRCGIATFTSELQRAVAGIEPALETSIVAMNDRSQGYDYPEAVRIEIAEDSPEDYLAAATLLNTGQVDVVSLQHEFGIFGGKAGRNILPLLDRLTAPVVTTFHTVLARPNQAQREVMDRVIKASSKVVVMAEKGRALLQDVYGVAPEKIVVISHGVPDVPYCSPEAIKRSEGYDKRRVILTFGLLSPNKGIEVMIDAMPAILKACPSAVYVVLGATHPNLIRKEGEAYRESLVARVAALGIEDHVVFLDQFVDQATLLRHIGMCDVYVTPYLNEEQMTSGTLAYSHGLGRAVVSTPYWHAQELLAGGAGVLVPFGDSPAIGRAVADLLTHDDRRMALAYGAYERSRSKTWAHAARRYLKVFEEVAAVRTPVFLATKSPTILLHPVGIPPEISIDHLMAMSDDTGLFQHAVHAVPDRAHGYCIDDNARALLLAVLMENSSSPDLPSQLAGRFSSFVQHAWNPDIGRFRNFMSFDRRWLEDMGSEDSHGRTLWALGICAKSDMDAARRTWASGLFLKALVVTEQFHSPRAIAATLLGLDAYCKAEPEVAEADRMRLLLAERLMGNIAAAETPEWIWFEDVLSYDNARLSEALILTGMSTGVSRYLRAGLRTLEWLMTQQTTSSGVFRPVGSHSFGALRQPPQPFDQQPLEATATISACAAAWRATNSAKWRNDAERAFAWFLGVNDLNVPLADVRTGRCRDGLHPDRANENCGAESVVCYLLSLLEIRRMLRTRESRPESAMLQTPLPRIAAIGRMENGAGKPRPR
ncbi:glycosyltransferase family 4 protein [Oryzibacter oryziterrae]|uniref:glycosyltransferase family 4 protein n=1 Tax=Oryzibacter oryziterrae TaxID=2766474 RepID=UPI001F1BD472|nr:glycosyltransferase family 4 protein [Oryzibacter oryziterrae]